MKLAGVLGALVLTWPAVAAADPIVVTAVRNVGAVATLTSSGTPTANVDANRDTMAVTTELAGPGTSTAHAALASTITPVHLAGAGWADSAVATTTGAFAYGYVNYIVGLDLDRAYAFSFTGQFSASGTDAGDPGQPISTTTWQAALRQGNFNGPEIFDRRGDGSQLIREEGRLGPGAWVFLVNGLADTSTHVPGSRQSLAAFAFSFDLTPATDFAPTPEPASMWLLGTGLAGALTARRGLRRDPAATPRREEA